MMKQLRKRHLQIWTLLLFILPAGILAAWMSVKNPVNTDILTPNTSSALPIIIKSVNKENYSIAIRTNMQGSLLQLEWINRSAIKVPSALLYKLTGQHHHNISENDLIGRIAGRNSFYFALQNSNTNDNRFILYDIIHHKIIDTINLNP